MIKLTGNDILVLVESLEKLQNNADLHLSAKVNFLLAKVAREVQPLHQILHETRTKVLVQTGAEVDESGNYRLTTDGLKLLKQELTPVLEEENTFTFSKLPLAEIENYSLPFEIVNGLYCIIEE